MPIYITSHLKTKKNTNIALTGQLKGIYLIQIREECVNLLLLQHLRSTELDENVYFSLFCGFDPT